MPTTRTAAVFDLDRTIIGGATAAVFQRHLHHVGIGPAGDHPVVGAQELTRTYPPGDHGDANQETERRPGIDTVTSGPGGNR